MSEDDRGRARGECSAQDHSDVDGADDVLAPDGGDVRADDAVLAVEKEAREVLSVGPPDEGVGDTCGAAALGDGLVGEPEWSSGLDQAHFVDGDGVAGA